MLCLFFHSIFSYLIPLALYISQLTNGFSYLQSALPPSVSGTALSNKEISYFRSLEFCYSPFTLLHCWSSHIPAFHSYSILLFYDLLLSFLYSITYTHTHIRLSLDLYFLFLYFRFSQSVQIITVIVQTFRIHSLCHIKELFHYQ